MPLPLFASKSSESAKEKKLSSKEKKYVANIERALAGFASVDEWADYIAFLSKLQKALNSNPDPGNQWVPHGFEVSKDLALCMSSKLPGGVQLKAIELYKTIFDTLGPEQMSQQCQIWLPGIFPLMSYASISVKPELIALYQKYLYNIDPSYLRAVFRPLLLSLLPALDDTTSEFFDTILDVLTTFKRALHNDIHFWQCLFLCIITSADRRSGAMELCFKKLPDFNDDTVFESPTRDLVTKALSQEARECVTPEPGLLIRALCEGLKDENLLVQRGFFDLLLSKLQLSSNVFQYLANDKDKQMLILSASDTVLRRDMSLNRRLWNWFLGPETTTPMTPNSSAQMDTDGRISRSEYFEKYGCDLFAKAMLSLIDGTATDQPRYRQIIRACRIAVAIMDRWEIGQLIIPKVFVPVLEASRAVKDEDPDHFDELLKSAGVFFDGVETVTIWSDVYMLIKKGEIELVSFVLKNFHVEEEEMIVSHIPFITLSLLALYPPKGDQGQHYLELLNSLLQLIPQRALLPLDHANAKYMDTSIYDSPEFKLEVVSKLNQYYGHVDEDEDDHSSDRPYTGADLSAMYLGFISHITASIISTNPTGFYHFSEMLKTVLDKIPVGQVQWNDPTLLNAVMGLSTSEVPVAFGVSIIFKIITKSLKELDKTAVLKIALTLLWKCLICPSGRYQVEAAKKIWELQTCIDPHYIEAGLSGLFLECDESTHIRAFNILWAQSASFSDAILRRPLYLILDDIESDNTAHSVLVAKWLQDILISGTMNRIFKICCSGLLAPNAFVESGTYNSNDDFGLMAYELKTLYNLLNVSPTTILPVFNTELCVIDRDSEMQLINANHWNISTYKSLALAVLKSFMLIDPPKHFAEGEFQQYSRCMKLSLDLIGLILDGTEEEEFNEFVNLVVTACQRKVDDDRNHELTTCYLNTLIKLMKISSKKQAKLSLFETPAEIKQGSKFLDFVCEGIESSLVAIELRSWIDLVLQTSEYYSELSFASTMGLTGQISDKIEELFSLNMDYLNGQAVKGATDVDDSISELISGLQSLLTRSHKYLGYLLSGNFAYTNTYPGNAKSPESGFFGSVIQGVFQVEPPTEKSVLQKRKIILLKAFKRAVTTAYQIWIWSDDNSKVETLETQKPFLSFSSSIQYNASKLKFRCKKLLEAIYSMESLETLETLINCYQSDRDGYSTFKIVHVMDSSKQQESALPYILDSLGSRINMTSLEPEKRSSMLTHLTPEQIATFLVEYSTTLHGDVLEDSYNETSKFLKDISAGASSWRPVYPELLKFAAVIGTKQLATSFGEQRKVKRDIADTFSKVLSTALTTKFVQYDAGLGSISVSVDSTAGFSSKSVVRKDLCEVLVDVVPAIPVIITEPDKRTASLTLIINNVASPLSRHESGNTPPAVLDLFKALADQEEIANLKIWKTLCFDMVNDANFFKLDVKDGWNEVLEKWIVADQERFNEVITRLSNYTSTNTNIFNWSDSEAKLAGILELKRVAYLLLLCPKDTFINFEPRLQDRLYELLHSATNGFLMPYIFLVVRAMVLKYSEVHLLTFWPTIYSELETVFHQMLEKLVEMKLDTDILGVEDKVPAAEQFDSVLIFQASKLLDYLLVLEDEEFQMDEWLFVNDNSDVVYGRGDAPVLSLIDRIASMKNLKVIQTSNPVQINSTMMEGAKKKPLLLGVTRVDQVFELKQFFDRLAVYKYETDYEMKELDLDAVDSDLLNDIFAI